MQYSQIVDIVKACFPQVQEREECKQIARYGDDTPYLFFPAFWKLLELCLTGLITDNNLRDKILDFMEEMALCDDRAVVDLLVVEMLEPIFGLKYDIYRTVVYRLLRTKTLQLHQLQLPYFHIPKPEKLL